jgi:hypothetical protein
VARRATAIRGAARAGVKRDTFVSSRGWVKQTTSGNIAIGGRRGAG